MSKKQSEEKVVKMKNAQPVVTIDDVHNLVGPLYANNYPTLKCRLVQQVVKTAVFSAYSFKDEDEDSPRSSAADIEAQLASTTPYKDGIDASLVEREKPLLAGKKPRADLVFDLLYHPDMDEDKVRELAESIKQEAVQAQIQSLVKRAMGSGSGGSKGVGRRVAAGLHRLDTCDETWDEAFLTNAAEFLVNYTQKTFTDFDEANLNYLRGILEGRPEEKETPISFAI